MKQPLWLSLFAGLAVTTTAFAQDPKLPYEKYTLSNGMEVILQQDKSVPLVAVDVWYHTGSSDDTQTRSGFAHLFEHMMFQGSKHTGADQHFNVLRKIGGSSVNGSTADARTNYFEVVPSHQLETALWLESDRMGYLLPLLTQESMKNQIDVVRNERRENYDTQPYTKAEFKIRELLYGEDHPYRYLGIGKHEDLEAASVSDVKEFFKKWYAPANATLVLAGDFETADAKKLVEKWFGNFPKTSKPAHKEFAMPTVSKEQRVEISDELAPLVQIHYTWATPKYLAAGDPELQLLGTIIGNSGTGRLYKALMIDKELVEEVYAYQDSQRLSSEFHLVASLNPDTKLEDVEKIINDELAKIAKEPVSAKELSRAVLGFESGYIYGLESLIGRAEVLQDCNHWFGSPDCITKDLDRYRKVTPEQIRDTAAKYLQTTNRIVIISKPTGGNQ
jgi:zinc protease